MAWSVWGFKSFKLVCHFFFIVNLVAILHLSVKLSHYMALVVFSSEGQMQRLHTGKQWRFHHCDLCLYIYIFIFCTVADMFFFYSCMGVIEINSWRGSAEKQQQKNWMKNENIWAVNKDSTGETSLRKRPSLSMQMISPLCCVVFCQQHYFWCYSLHII